MTESLTSAGESSILAPRLLAPRLLARMHGDDDDDDATPPATAANLAIMSADFSQTCTAHQNSWDLVHLLIVAAVISDNVSLFCAQIYRFFPSPECYLATTNERNVAPGQDQPSNVRAPPLRR